MPTKLMDAPKNIKASVLYTPGESARIYLIECDESNPPDDFSTYAAKVFQKFINGFFKKYGKPTGGEIKLFPHQIPKNTHFLKLVISVTLDSTFNFHRFNASVYDKKDDCLARTNFDTVIKIPNPHGTLQKILTDFDNYFEALVNTRSK